jgi:protein involved in polysaccharide export with SLBB domain
VKDLQQKTIDEMVARMERELLAEGATVKETSAEGVQARQVELQQRQKFIETLRKLPPTGRMTIYLAHLRLLKGSVYDIELEEGDSLFIPTKNSVVNVAGAVMFNGSFVYVDGLGFEEYIRMAGGYSRYADTSSTFVMKVDGSARKLPGSVNWNPFQKRWEIGGFGEARSVIEAGDSIVVPEKLERTAWLREFKDITQIFANVGLTAASIAMLYQTIK